ncbi:hypothetical protein SprV_0602172500 [Sparganum proliferum]
MDEILTTTNKTENTSAGDCKRQEAEISPPTLLLRVKRPFSEPPVECFNTVPCKKRCQWYPEVQKGKCFRYVGSTTQEDTLNEGGLDALQDMGAVGARRIFWTSTSTACVINPEDEKKIDYKVHLSGTKRRLSSSPKRCSQSPPEVVAAEPTEGGPPSSKCLRVIDLQSYTSTAPTTDPLAITMNGLRLVATPVEPQKVESEEASTVTSDNNFVYDVYRIDPGARIGRFSSEGSDLENSDNRYVYVDVEDAEYKDDGDIFEDDSDSNSESNWRNDYPDDDDEFAYLDKDDEDTDDDDHDDDDSSDEDNELSRHRPYQLRRALFSSDPFGSLLL